jgi:exonuclease SbcD
VKLVHTSDWHVGKTLRGMSRLDEHRAVLGEIADLAAAEQVDLVLVTGDLFESAAPTPDAQRVVWDALLRLRDSGARVVAIGGNHDNQPAFDAWAAVAAAAGITLLGQAQRPDEGGFLRFETRAGEPVRLALLPFVSQRFAVRTEQLLELDASQTAGLYAERMRLIIEALCADFEREAVNIFATHCFVRGGALGGGERDAQTIFDYGIEAPALPTNASYVALGHLHRTQRMGAAAPAYYAGSPVQVDFGEERDTKHALLVDLEPGVPARVTPHRLASGWSLRTIAGTMAELAALAGEVGDAWLRVVVDERTRAGLADEVRELLPRAIDIRVSSPRERGRDTERGQSHGRSPHDLFTTYLELRGVDDANVERLFSQLYEEELHGVDA